MSDVRANAGVPVLAQFSGVSTPSPCAPIVIDSTTGFIYTLKTGDVVVLAGPGSYVLPTATSTTLGGVKPDGTTITNTSGAISVTFPLTSAPGTAAYTASSAYATSAQGTTADAAMPKAGGTFTGNVLFTDNTYDIGASGATRPRSLFLSSTMTAAIKALINRTTTIFASTDRITADYAGGTENGLVLNDTANGNNAGYCQFAEAGSVIGSITRVAQTSAVAFNTTSDANLKNILGDSDIAAASKRVMSYRMRDFEWKDCPGVLMRGPIAQEVYAINPDQMLVSPSSNEAGISKPWTLNMAWFIPDLIMAIQAQQKQIDALMIRLAAT